MSTRLRRPYRLSYGETSALKGYSTNEYRYLPKLSNADDSQAPRRALCFSSM